MTSVEDLKRRSVSGVVSYSLRSALLYLIAIGATALLSAFLSPADFGVYFVVTALIGVFTFLSDIGLAAALIQKKDEPTLKELQTSFTVQQLLAFSIFLFIILLTPVWQRYSKIQGDGLWLLYALGFSFILASFKTIPSILLERQLKFQTLVIPQMVEQVLFYTVAVYLAYRGYGIASFTLAVLVRSLSGLAVIYWLQPWPIGLAFSQKAFKSLLHFGFKFQLNDLLARLKDDLFVVVLARFLPLTEMGYLGWAKKWSMFPYQFSVQNVIAITFPTFSRVQHETRLIARGLEASLYFISLIIFPILFGMTALAQPLIQVVASYTKWQPALPALYLFCLNIGFAAIANPFINALNALGKINLTLKIMLLMTLATWILTPLFWWRFGFTGVAFVAALVAGISLSSIILFKQIIPVSILPRLKVPLVSSGCMMASVLLLGQVLVPGWSSLVLQLVTGTIVYGLVVIFLGKKQLTAELHHLIPKWF